MCVSNMAIRALCLAKQLSPVLVSIRKWICKRILIIFEMISQKNLILSQFIGNKRQQSCFTLFFMAFIIIVLTTHKLIQENQR